MGQVAKILHDVPNQRTRYAAVGRPLELLVVAPYQGQLFWCRGSVYSFYQLDRPDQQPLSDRQWKACSALPPSLIEEPAALGGLRSALRELGDRDDLSSEPGRLWILLCLRILDGRVPPEGREPLKQLLLRTQNEDGRELRYIRQRVTELLNRGRVTTWEKD